MQKFILLSILFITAITGYSQKRIVSLAASITQNLYLLGANEDIVGCTRFCITEPADSIPVVADAVNVNMEKIVALRPDIVLTGGLTPPKVLEGLERMGIKTLRLEQPKNFEEICEQFIILGELSNKKTKAESTVQECKTRLEEAKKNIPSDRYPKVFMEIGCDPLYTARIVHARLYPTNRWDKYRQRPRQCYDIQRICSSPKPGYHFHRRHGHRGRKRDFQMERDQ